MVSCPRPVWEHTEGLHPMLTLLYQVLEDKDTTFVVLSATIPGASACFHLAGDGSTVRAESMTGCLCASWALLPIVDPTQ